MRMPDQHAPARAGNAQTFGSDMRFFRQEIERVMTKHGGKSGAGHRPGLPCIEAHETRHGREKAPRQPKLAEHQIAACDRHAHPGKGREEMAGAAG